MDDEAAAYAARLARVIITASDALERGDIDFAGRLLRLFADKIRQGLDEKRAEQDERATRH